METVAWLGARRRAAPRLASRAALVLLGALAGLLGDRLLTARRQLDDAAVLVDRAERDLQEARGEAQQSGDLLANILGSMLNAVTMGTAVRDESGAIEDFQIEYANAAAAELYGTPVEQLRGRRWLELWQRPRDDAMMAAFVRLVETGEAVELIDFPYAVAGSDGVRSGFVDYRATRFGDGYVATWRDVTARHRAIEELAAASSQLAAAFDRAPVGMVLLAPERTVVRANEAFGALIGREHADLVGVSLDDILDPRDIPDSREDFGRLLSGEAPVYRRERRLRTAHGESRWVLVSVARVEGSEGLYVVEHFEDIHDRKGYERRLQYLADHDALTGLFNRRRFREELMHQMTLDRRYQQISTVVLLDLDNFKYINDTLGHPTGDQFLQAISKTLRGRLRDSDVIGRLGGDEFAVLLPATDVAEATTVAASLLDGIRSTELDHVGQRVRSTGSAGISRIVVADATDPDDALATADLAMYAAKEAGRDTTVVYDPHGEHAALSRARFRWLDRIRHALEHDLFQLLAQPILDLRTGQIDSCELLLRMRDGERLVDPDEFLPIAERHGLATAIDKLVITRAIGIVAAHQHNRPSGFRWEINLSADSLADPSIPHLIETALAEAGVSPASLVFEITETAAITNIGEAQAFATRLGDIGCRFALDDFGAGYGSFYYLKHLPFEFLKIDGEFIRQLPHSRTDSVIVGAIVSAAHELGKQTIAEYVGDDQTLEILRGYGVDQAQGYYIGRPVDPAQPLPGARALL